MERSVLNTNDVNELVRSEGVVSLIADWSDAGEEIGNTLKALGTEQLPLLAIFPAGDPYNPIVIYGGYSKSTLISAINDGLDKARLSDTTTAHTSN